MRFENTTRRAAFAGAFAREGRNVFLKECPFEPDPNHSGKALSKVSGHLHPGSRAPPEPSRSSLCTMLRVFAIDRKPPKAHSRPGRPFPRATP